MDSNRAAENLAVIRQLMERPVKISTQSGLGAILAGCAALAGVVMDGFIFRRGHGGPRGSGYAHGCAGGDCVGSGCGGFAHGGGYMDGHYAGGGVLMDSSFWSSAASWLNLAVWGVVFAVAVAAALGVMRFREVRRGLPFWTPAKRRMLSTILWPFVIGAGLTAAIVYHGFVRGGFGEFGLIPAVWMLTYGLACWNMGQYSIREIRVMGAAFMVAGLLTAAFFQVEFPGLPPGLAPYATLGVTFGGFHMVYGVVVWVRHGG